MIVCNAKEVSTKKSSNSVATSFFSFVLFFVCSLILMSCI